MKDDSVTRQLERKIDQAKRIIAASDRVLGSDMVPGSFITGSSNRGNLDKRWEQDFNRHMQAGLRREQAVKNLAMLEARLAAYRAGEVHANGQPKADSPSRHIRKRTNEVIADYLRATLTKGGVVGIAANLPHCLKIKRINKKSITSDSGTIWTYDELWPCHANGQPMTNEEFKAALTAFTEAHS